MEALHRFAATSRCISQSETCSTPIQPMGAAGNCPSLSKAVRVGRRSAIGGARSRATMQDQTTVAVLVVAADDVDARLVEATLAAWRGHSVEPSRARSADEATRLLRRRGFHATIL